MDSHKVSLTDEITAIVEGWNHSLALKGDGTVWEWGWNGEGELGNGTNTNSNVPVIGCLRPAIKKSRYAFDFLDVMSYIDSRS